MTKYNLICHLYPYRDLDPDCFSPDKYNITSDDVDRSLTEDNIYDYTIEVLDSDGVPRKEIVAWDWTFPPDMAIRKVIY